MLISRLSEFCCTQQSGTQSHKHTVVVVHQVTVVFAISGVLTPASMQAERYQMGVKRLDFDFGLAPYPDHGHPQWCKLSGHIDEARPIACTMHFASHVTFFPPLFCGLRCLQVTS